MCWFSEKVPRARILSAPLRSVCSETPVPPGDSGSQLDDLVHVVVLGAPDSRRRRVRLNTQQLLGARRASQAASVSERE